MNELERIQQRIEEVGKQSAELRADLAEQKLRLEKAKNNQRDAILKGQGGDVNNAEAEIVGLTTRNKGTIAAIESTNTTLQQLQAEKKHELNKIRTAQVEQLRDEIRNLFREIYTLLIDLAGKVKQLDTKRGEYKTILKANDHEKLRQFSERSAHVKILLVAELTNILGGFEYDLFDKSGLPTPESLKKSMR